MHDQLTNQRARARRIKAAEAAAVTTMPVSPTAPPKPTLALALTPALAPTSAPAKARKTAAVLVSLLQNTFLNCTLLPWAQSRPGDFHVFLFLTFATILFIWQNHS